MSHDALRIGSIVLGGLMVIVLAIGSKIRGFKPGRGRLDS
jgi:hypothetical protein